MERPYALRLAGGNERVLAAPRSRVISATMETQFRPANFPQTTRAAEGLLRRRWTMAELDAAVEAGILADDERFELIGGEVVAMAAKGIRHENVRNLLNFRWARQCPEHLMVAFETPLRLDLDMAPEPDLIVHPASIMATAVDGPSVPLVVEIADSSVTYDLATKAPIYAAHGVREYWVIDAWTLKTRVHRRLASAGYDDVQEFAATDLLTPALAPELALALSELRLG